MHNVNNKNLTTKIIAPICDKRRRISNVLLLIVWIIGRCIIRVLIIVIIRLIGNNESTHNIRNYTCTAEECNKRPQKSYYRRVNVEIICNAWQTPQSFLSVVDLYNFLLIILFSFYWFWAKKTLTLPKAPLISISFWPLPTIVSPDTFLPSTYTSPAILLTETE